MTKQHCPACNQPVPNYVLYRIYVHGFDRFTCKSCGCNYEHKSLPVGFYKRFLLLIILFTPIFYLSGELFINKINIWVAVMLALTVIFVFLTVFVVLPKEYRRCPFIVIKQ
ncbi:MAG: hypothetical protein ACMZ64_06675 [Oleiphilus sp.]